LHGALWLRNSNPPTRSPFGNEAEQIVSGLACLRRRTHDGAFVFAQELDPRANVIGMAQVGMIASDAQQNAALNSAVYLNSQVALAVFSAAFA
jgi:hypothetical protein